MSAQNKIEKYQLQDRTLELSARPGLTHTQIAEILTTELAGRASVSQATVSRWLKAVRQERGEQTRQVVQDHIQATVPADLQALEEVEGWLLGIFRDQTELLKIRDTSMLGDRDLERLAAAVQASEGDGFDLSDRANAAMKAVKIIELKLRFAGILEDPHKTGSTADPVNLDDYRIPATDAKNAEAR